MKDVHLLGLLLIIVTLILCFVKVFQEGFVTNQELYNKQSELYEKKFSKIGAALSAVNNEAALGSSTRDIFGGIQNTMDSNNNITQTITDPYPVEGGVSGMSLIIKACEAIKTTDCNIFDNAVFSKNCGVCLDIGTNSEGQPQTGGLVLTSKDKAYGKSQQKGNFLAPYIPTVGFCPSGKMVATKAECLRLQNQLTCQKGGTFGTPAGCSQCFNDGTYHVVDPSSQADLIIGSGILTVVGSGTLEFSESGSSALDNNNLSLELSSNPQSIPLSGPEYTKVTLKVNPYPVPTPYQDSKTYRANDFISFIKDNVKNVYQMQEGAGAPGYAPDRPGDRLWIFRGTWDNYPYKVATPTFIAGYLQTPNEDESQNMDLYRIIMTDSQTGRKPRTIGQVTMEGQSFTKIGTGFGKTFMNLIAYSPFSFVDPLSQEASLCPGSPFITNPESARLLNSDPCYAKGSGPGTYSLECLQQVFQNNGCGLSSATLDKSGFPSTNAKAATLMVDEYGATLKINEIADTIYRAAVATATGVDSSGKKLSITDWSTASVFCTGVAINSPCDTLDENGKLTDECIVYLWDNQGENKIPKATYSLGSLARSMFSTGSTTRLCTRSGTYAPKNSSNLVNETNLAYWKNRGDGSVAAVKAAMAQLHLDANSNLTTEDAKANFIKQCYGITPSDRPNYSTNYQPDTSVQSGPPPIPLSISLTRASSVPSNIQNPSISISSNGTKMVVLDRGGGKLYISANTGTSWSQVSLPSVATAWVPNTIASSSNGNIIALTLNDGNGIFVSTNAGSSWIKSTTSWAPHYMAKITMSSDGTKIFAATSSAGYLTRSLDSGATFSNMASAPIRNGWPGICCSSNGSIVYACEYGGGIWKSNDSGATWSVTSAPNDGNQYWQNVQCSYDGTKLIAGQAVGSTVYISRNSGSSWAPTTVPDTDYVCVACSGDGTKMAVAPLRAGSLSTSIDSGQSWQKNTASNSGAGWVEIQISSDGSTMIGCKTSEGVYISNMPVQNTPLVGSLSASVSRSGVGWSL